MKTNLYATVLVSLFLLVFSQNCVLAADENTFNVWMTIDHLERLPVKVNGHWQSDNEQINVLFDSFQVSYCERALPDSRRESLLKVYEVRGTGSYEAFLKSCDNISQFSKIEKAPEYELLSSNLFPDDYSLVFNNDYALDLIDAQKAWEYSTGDTNTIIGVTDGAFFINHEELQGAYTYVLNDYGLPSSYFYHGTAVAVAAAGNTNNGQGKSAIGYDCRMSLVPIGYNYMLQLCYQGIRVINVSWSSGCNYIGYYGEVIDELFDNDCIVVAAAGNGNTCGGPNGVVYPASLDGVISVTSVGPYDNHEMVIGNPNTTHQHNEFVDICAPGYQIAGSAAPGYYLTGSGTSFATPYVSGTIGLMLSLKPCLSREEVIEILSITADDVYASNPSDLWGLLGAGRLNAGDALEYVASYQCQQAPMVVDDTVGLLSIFNPKPSSGQTSGDIRDEIDHWNLVAGTNELTDQAVRVTVFPNPNKGIFKVQWEAFQPDEIIVTDATGSVVLKRRLSVPENDAVVELKQSGLYLVQIIAGGKIVTHEKVVVH